MTWSVYQDRSEELKVVSIMLRNSDGRSSKFADVSTESEDELSEKVELAYLEADRRNEYDE